MFFYPDVLQRHTGCFATIWLAATKGRKLTKKEIMKVAVSQTCEEVIRYITAQVPASQPGQPRPRFSLYLSSQLQYGVVLVYHRQCVLMLEEAQRIFEKTKKSPRNDLDMPDRMFLMEQADDTEDPFFGVMTVASLPSPSQMLLHTSPPERITIKEQQSLVVNTAEICGGMELTEPTEEELNLLMAMPDNFLDGIMAELELEKRNKDNNTVAEQERDTRDNNTPVPGSVNSVDQRSANQMSPASSLQNPPADPPQVVVRPKKRPAGSQKREKRMVIDTMTQNSAAVMKRHIDNPLTETRSLSEVMSLTSIMKRKTSPALLFSTPCSLMLHSDMLAVWTQCAQITALKKRTLRKRRSSEMTSTDSAESNLQPAEPSSVPDLQSHSDCNTPATRSPRGEVQVPMQPIAEEIDEMPDAQSLLRLVSSHHQRSHRVTFDTLLPLWANRLTAARTMFKLLEMVEAKELVVLQTEAFSPMMITPVQ